MAQKYDKLEGDESVYALYPGDPKVRKRILKSLGLEQLPPDPKALQRIRETFGKEPYFAGMTGDDVCEMIREIRGGA